ncbi:MAG: BrnA antitoxin family protein [Cypionkella sp.]|nr:BrnA antitoxin family protein [Cypionkella sp.]
MSDIRTATLDDIKAMIARGEVLPPRDDAPEYDLPDDFWEKAVVQPPLAKSTISMRVDPDILAFFKSQGAGHLTRMHAVLRAYVDAQLAKQKR